MYGRTQVLNNLKELAAKYAGASNEEIFANGAFKRFFASPLAADTKVRHYSLFVDQDLENSDRLIKLFYKLTTFDQLLQLSIEKISLSTVHPILVKYSLAVAISQAPIFQKLKSQVPQAMVFSPNHIFVDKNIPKRWRNPDTLLKWWREDPMLNSHHLNWHIAYPSFGVSLNGEPAQIKDRQGELFVFMHRQMVARYDSERTALGLQPIDPFGSNSYREPLGDAFDPLLSLFVPRPADSQMRDNVACTAPFDSISVVDLEIWRERLFEAIQNRAFKKTIVAADGSIMTKEVPMTITDLGSSLEATIGSPNKSYYGNLNKQAHNLMSRVFDPQGEEQTSIGIMGDLIGAFRDPMFWRWHKHLDEFFHRFEMTLQPYNLAEYAPPAVRVLNTIVRRNFAASPFVNQQTGLIDIALKPATNLRDNHLTTYMKTQIISITEDGSILQYLPGAVNDQGNVLNSYETTRLYYVPFTYEIQLANEDAQFKKVTVRIYMVANDDFADRRKWLAMDQFYTSLPAGQTTTTISRTSSESTILQQAIAEEWPGNWEGLVGEQPITETYCKCGLPRNLLLPRGTKEGMRYRLCVVVTDARFDVIAYGDGQSSCCDGNIYCGTYNKPYPFKLDMGFPFNRSIPSQADSAEEKMEMYLTQPHVYKGDVTIQWESPKPSAA
eukprot:gene11555-13488_t